MRRGCVGSTRTWIVDTIAPNGTELCSMLPRVRHICAGGALAPRVSDVHGLDLVPECCSKPSGWQRVHDQPLNLEDRMARIETPATIRDEIRRRLDEEMHGGSPTGFAPIPGCRRA